MRHAMIDIETLGTRIGSVIMSIGGVVFDPQGTGTEMPPFRTTIDIADSLKSGLTVDGPTIYWWLEQSDAARKALTGGSDVLLAPTSLRKALEQLVTWYREFTEPRVTAVWSHGLSFDLILLGAAFDKVGIRPPWHYRDMRDTRTLFDVAGPFGYWDNKLDPLTGRPKELIDHEPLSDAIQQSEWVQRAYWLIGRSHGQDA